MMKNSRVLSALDNTLDEGGEGSLGAQDLPYDSSTERFQSIAGQTRAGDVDVRRDGVLFVLPSLTKAGAQSQVMDLLETMDAANWRKYLVTFAASMDQLDRVDGAGVAFRHYRRRWKLDFRFVMDMARLIDEEEITVVHATLNIAVLSAWLAIRLSRRKPPLVAALHTTINRSYKDDIAETLIYRRIFRRCDRIIFVSVKQMEHWLRKTPWISGYSSVIHNGIDVSRYDRSVDDSSEDAAKVQLPAGKVVSCIAGFRPEKGHAILLDAWEMVLKDHPDAKLVLVGSGPRQARIRELVRNRSMEASVRFTGLLADVRPVLRASSITVLPSTAVETLSLAALEAMAMQVPVIASDIGGMSEAIEDGKTGFVVPPGDANALAKAVCTLLADSARCEEMGKRARARVTSIFDRRVMTAETEVLLSSVCQQLVPVCEGQ